MNQIQKTLTKEIFLETCRYMWYFMDRLFKRLSHIPHASGLLAGCSGGIKESVGGMIGAAVQPKGGTLCPQSR
jgi:hypothetical protein